MAWKNICEPKNYGGLGIQRLSAMNSAMLEKIGWSLVNDSDKLWVKALKAKYLPFSTCMNCWKKKNCSHLWPAVLNTHDILMKSLCFKVGRGNNINIWEDPWLLDTPSFKLIPRNDDVILRNDDMILTQRMVQQLKNTNGEWNLSLIKELFSHNSTRDICKIFCANNDEDDKILWVGNINDAFSIKFFYLLENWSGVTQSP